MKYLLIGLLKAYRTLISPLYGQVCRYHPSCSAYALEAVTVHGSVRGSWLAVRRLAAATRGRPVATTLFLIARRRRARPTDSRSLSAGLPRHRLRHHGAALLRHLAWSWSASTGCSAPCSDPDGRLVVGALDRRADPGHPRGADPAVRQADQVQPQHAADPAQGQGAAEEVRPRPGAARPGDDGALQGDEHQPVRLVPARSCCRCRSSSRCSGCSTPASHDEAQGRADLRPGGAAEQRDHLRGQALRHLHQRRQREHADPGRRSWCWR